MQLDERKACWAEVRANRPSPCQSTDVGCSTAEPFLESPFLAPANPFCRKIKKP
jgi:hypothetical protein